MTSWADSFIEKLNNGESVTIKPRGHSMEPRIKDRQPITVNPQDSYKVGDAVLCKVNGRIYVHIVKAKVGDKYLIMNNKGKVNGWTSAVYGKVDEDAESI